MPALPQLITPSFCLYRARSVPVTAEGAVVIGIDAPGGVTDGNYNDVCLCMHACVVFFGLRSRGLLHSSVRSRGLVS